jgi:hypothetical protein
MAFPEDIFTEPDSDPDTLANLGPLRRLAGIWQSRGGTGRDLNPKADGPEHKEFSERIELQPIDAQPNGPQLFYGLRYHTRINAVDEQATFHDQTGYWLWEPRMSLVIQTLSIPRGQVAIASGSSTPDANELILTARRGDPAYGICSNAFLEYAFRTESYRIQVTFNADGSWSYVQETVLMVHGRSAPFVHRDTNTLVKVAEPTPNPLMLLLKKQPAAGTP